MFFAALTPLLPHYADELGLSKAGAGILQAAFPAGALLGALPSGLVASRFGVKATVVAGLSVFAATSAAFGFAEAAWELDVARALQGFASSFSWTGGLAWIVAAAPAGRRGQLIGSALAVAIVGALFGPVLGGIASKTGTGPAFTAVAALALVLAFWAARTPSARPEAAPPVWRLLDALRHPRVVAAFWFVTLPGLLFGTLSVLGPLRLSQLGLGSLAIGTVWLVSAAIEATLAPSFGRFSDRRGPLVLLRGGALAASLALVLLPWPSNEWLLAVVIVGASISFGSFWTPSMSLLADASEDHGIGYGWGFAIVNLAWAPGQAVGSAAGGGLAKLVSDRAVYLGLAAVCVATFVQLARRPWLASRA